MRQLNPTTFRCRSIAVLVVEGFIAERLHEIGFDAKLEKAARADATAADIADASQASAALAAAAY